MIKKKFGKSMFKNDPFGIKYKLFRMRLERHLAKECELRGKELKMYLYVIRTIGVPKTEDAKQLLITALAGYDKLVVDVNKDLEKAREYAKWDVEERSVE